MHIAVNAHLLSPVSGYRQAGISGYVEQLLRRMLRLNDDTRWTVYAAPGVSPDRVGAPEGVRWRQSLLPTTIPQGRILWEQFVAPGLLAIDRPDLLFCPLNVVPLLTPCKTVVTVHDLAFLRFNVHRTAKRKYLSVMTRASVRRANHVITVSEFTRQEVIDLLNVHPERVTAIPNGRDERMTPLDADAAQAFRVRKQLPSRFLLFIGTLEPRKNLPTLLRAYATAKDRLDMPLLIGGGKGWWFQEIFDLVKSLGITDKVRFLGFVPAEELPRYYATATALVYPSLYEGFGLPPLEALASGLPVVTSDARAVCEVVGDAAISVPALDADALAGALIRITQDEALRQQLRSRGLIRAENYSWERAAKETLHLLRRIVTGTRGDVSSTAANSASGYHAGVYANSSADRTRTTQTLRGPRRPAAPLCREAPRRILLMSHSAVASGAEIAMLNLCQHLDRRLYTPVVLFCSDGPMVSEFRRTAVETHVLPLDASIINTRIRQLRFSSLFRFQDMARFIAYVSRLSRFIRFQRIQFVHTNSLKSHVLGGMAAQLARIPVLWHLRNRVDSSYLPGLAAPLFRSLCRIIPDYVVSVSAAVRDMLRIHTLEDGRPQPPSDVVHDGVDHLRYAPGLTGACTLTPIVGLVGRISPFKGQHVFLQAVAIVRQRFPSTRFQIIGTAMFGEKDYAHHLEQLCAELGLVDCVEFTGFEINVPAALARLDVVVHASVMGEPFGQVIIEAMAAGKPVVATDGGGVPEIVEHARTGFLVPMADPQAMADAICELLANPANAAEMGRLGKQRVMRNFTIEAAASKIHHVYQQLLKRMTSRRGNALVYRTSKPWALSRPRHLFVVTVLALLIALYVGLLALD
jgi:glycosyltransferase involved in cell wall biosynthesis